VRASALILAAGGARRFGAAKQLASLHGRPLLQHVVDAVEAVPVLEETVVVLGARAAEVTAGIRLDGARVVQCEDWADGLSASLRAGVAALPPGTEAALILLGDQPLVTPPVISLVLQTAGQAFGAGTGAAAGAGPPPADAVRACYGGVAGHPVALGPRLLSLVPALRGDAGARDLLAGADVRLVEAGHLGDDTDIDTPEQLEAIIR
jgi:CTP:molybdopterin cytidylyltransferase MocA